MGADDDADCVEHIWGLVQLHPTADGVDSVKTCTRCGAPAYVVDRPGQDAARTRLA